MIPNVDEDKKKKKSGSSVSEDLKKGAAVYKSIKEKVAKVPVTKRPAPQKAKSPEKWYKGDKPTETETIAKIVKTAETDRATAEKAYSFYEQAKAEGEWKETYDKATSPYLAALGIEDPSQINDDFFAANADLLNAGVHTSTGALSSAKKNGADALLAYNLSGLMQDYNATKDLQTEQDQIIKEAQYWMNKGLSDDEIKQKLNIGGEGSKYKKIGAALDNAKLGKFTPTTDQIWAATSWGVDGMLFSLRNPDQSTGNYFNDAVQRDMGRGKTVPVDPVAAAKRDRGSAVWAPYSNGTTMDAEAIRFGVTEFAPDWAEKNRAAILASGDEEAIKAFGKVYAAEEFTKQAEEQTALFREVVQNSIDIGMSPDEIFYEGMFDDDKYAALNKLYAGYMAGAPAEVTRSVDFDIAAMKEQATAAYELKLAQKNAPKDPAAMQTAVEAEKQAQIEANGSLINTDTLPRSLTVKAADVYSQTPDANFRQGLLWAGAGASSGVVGSLPAEYGGWTDQQKFAAQAYITDMKDGYDTTEAIEEMRLAGLSDEQINSFVEQMSAPATYTAAEINEAIVNGDPDAAVEMLEADFQQKMEKTPELLTTDNAEKAAILALALAGEAGILTDPEQQERAANIAATVEASMALPKDGGGFYAWLDGVLNMNGALIAASENEGWGLNNTLVWALDHTAHTVTDLADKFIGYAITGAGKLFGNEEMEQTGEKWANEMDSTLAGHSDLLVQNGTPLEIIGGQGLSEIIKMSTFGKASQFLNAGTAVAFGEKFKWLTRMVSSTPFALESGIREFDEAYEETEGNYMTSFLSGMAGFGSTAIMSRFDGILKNIEAQGMPFISEVVESLATVPGAGAKATVARWGKAGGMWLWNLVKTGVNEAVQEPSENIVTTFLTDVAKGENPLDRDWSEYGKELIADAAMAFLISTGSSVSTMPTYANSVKVAEAQMSKTALTQQDVDEFISALQADANDPLIQEEAGQRAKDIAVEVRTGEIAAQTGAQSVDGSQLAAAEEKVAEAEQAAAETSAAVQQAAQEVVKANEQFKNDMSDQNAAAVTNAVQKKLVATQADQKAQNVLMKAISDRDAAQEAVQAESQVAMDTIRTQAAAEVEQAQQAIEQAQVEQETAAEVQRQNNNVLALQADDFVNEYIPNAPDEVKDQVRERYMAYDGETQNATRGMVEFASQISKKFNLNITFTDSHGIFEGAYKGGNDIVLDKNATQGEVIQRVLVHEITHAAENSKVYDALADAVLSAYYKGNTDQMNADLADIAQQYAEQAGQDSQSLARTELVAQRLSEMLSGNQEAMNRLVEEKPDVATRIWRAIKDFIGKLRGVRAPELDKLMKLEKQLEKALVTRSEKKNTTKFELRGYSETERTNWANSKRIVLYEDDAQAMEFIRNAINDKSFSKKLYFGAVSPELGTYLLEKTGLEVEGYNCTLNSNEVNKVLKKHGNEEQEALSGQRAIIPEDFLKIKTVMESPDDAYLSPDQYNGKPAIIFEKEIDGSRVSVVAVVSDKHLDLRMQTMYAGKQKKNLATPTPAVSSQSPTPEAARGTVPELIVSQRPETVNGEIEGENDQPAAEIIRGGATKFSLTSWTEKEKAEVRRDLIQNGYGPANVDQWIDNVNSVAAIIAGDKARLDYKAADNHAMLKNNQEYVKTLDASTLCAKRLLYQGTFNEIQHMLPNTVLTSEDLLHLSDMMNQAGLETPCGVCYVESRRRHLGKFAQEWLDSYSGEYKPTLDEVTTTDGLETLRINHPETYRSFVDTMNSKGSANPKVVQLRTDYRGDIRKLTKGETKKIIKIGGLRIQSFSDFETPHLIDMMQAVLDMSSRKLPAQAYTKVPNFAWVFGDTGIKINLSLLAEGNGLNEDGTLRFSSKEGMDIDEAMRLRERYSENVGTILVGVSEDHIRAAMADPRIDYIIPFHKSGWGQNELNLLPVLNSYDNFEDYQNERTIVGYRKNGKPKYGRPKGGNFYPIDYWDYSKSGDENAAVYLRMCEDDGRVPKFEQFLEKDADGHWVAPSGYWKMLIDFKMYDNDGNGAPQKAVLPIFNMEEAERVLKEYEGGADTLPVAYDIADRFVAEKKGANSGAKFSLPKTETEVRDKAYLKAVEEGDTDTARRMVAQKAQEEGFANAVPEQTLAYAVRKGAPPKKTIKVYKVFTVSPDGKPTALFVSGTEELPQNVWVDAQDTWHFTAKNGHEYVPSTQNPYTDGGKTGAQVEVPNDEIRAELIKRGFLPEGSKAKAVTALAYRPGWHAGDLPFFPQGGMKREGSNYENIHRYNQVVFECEFDADHDYTEEALNQDKARTKKGTINYRNADLQYMPTGGFYKYATNPLTMQGGHGAWFIGGSLKIGRALTQQECDAILEQNGFLPQEWEQGELDLSTLGYTGEQFDAAKKTLAPITYDNDGNVVPLSKRFDKTVNDIRFSLPSNDILDQRIAQHRNRQFAPAPNDIIPNGGEPAQSYGDGERQFAGQTMQNSPVVPDWIKQEFLRPEELNYETDTNREQVERSWQRIQENGYEVERDRLLSLDRYSADDTAEANLMMAMALREDTADPATFMALASHYNKEGTKAGQELQARKLFTRMSPTGARIWVTGKLENQLGDFIRKHKPVKAKADKAAADIAKQIRDMQSGDEVLRLNAGGDFTIDESNNRWGTPINQQQQALIDHYKLNKVARPGIFYNRATLKQRMLEAILATPNPLAVTGNGLNLIQRLELMQEGAAVVTNADIDYIGMRMGEFMGAGQEAGGRVADVAIARAYEAFGNITPASFGEKARTWRYISMLTSVPSAIRNVIGNASQNLVNATAHGIAVELDKIVAHSTGTRTAAHLSAGERVDGWKAFVEETKNTFRDYFVDKVTTQRGNDKYNTHQRGRVYQSGLPEGLRNVEGFLMSFGDRNMWRKSYINSLAEQQKLADQNLLFNEDGTTRTHEQMIEQAELDANYATFTEDNQVSNLLSQLKRVPVFGTVVDYIMPFTGVPANITRRMIQYSPIGIATTALKWGYDAVKGKNFDQQAFVNGLSRGLTGTALFGVGMVLAQMGAIKMGTGEEEDKKKYGLQTAMGQQYTPYIYNPFTDEYVSLAVFSPAASAITMGGAAWMDFKDNDDVIQALQNASLGSIDQIFDASYMTGLKDLFGGYGSIGENLMNSLFDTVVSQNVPTILAQLANTLDPYVRDTKDKNYIMQSLKSGLINKIPFLREQLLPEKVDVTGQTVRTKEGLRNFYDPFTTTDAREDPVVDELFRLNEVLGTSVMLPSDALSGTKNTLTINKQTVMFDDDAKEAYRKRYGELWMEGGVTLDKKGCKKTVEGVRELMDSPRYKRMDDEEKADAIKAILADAKTGATMEELKRQGE